MAMGMLIKWKEQERSGDGMTLMIPNHPNPNDGETRSLVIVRTAGTSLMILRRFVQIQM